MSGGFADGGNVNAGIASAISGIVGDLKRAISGLTTEIRNATQMLRQAAAQGATTGSNLGNGSPSMNPPGGGGGGGGGMMGPAMQGTFNKLMDITQDTISSPAQVLERQQLRWEFGTMRGPGGQTLQSVTEGMYQNKPHGYSGDEGYNKMAVGLASQGMTTGSRLQAQMESYANMYSLTGLENTAATGVHQAIHNPENSADLLAYGIDTFKPDGTQKSMSEISMEVMERFGGLGAKTEEQKAAMMTTGGDLDVWAQMVGGGDETATATARSYMQKAMQASSSGEYGTRPLTDEEIMAYHGADNPDNNPLAAVSAQEAAQGELWEETQDSQWKGLEKGMELSTDYLKNLGPIATTLGQIVGPLQTIASALNSTHGGPVAALGNKALDWIWPDGASEGLWNLEKDKEINLHRGEMVLPARIAEAVRSDLSGGGRPPKKTPQGISSHDEIMDLAVFGEEPAAVSVGVAEVRGRSDQQYTDPRFSNERDDFRIGLPKSPQVPGDSGGSTVSIPITVNVMRATEHEAIDLAEKVKQIIQQQASLDRLSKGI